VERDQENPKKYEDDRHSDNYWRESVRCLVLDHARDSAADGQRNKLANGLAAFALTHVRLKKFGLQQNSGDVVFAAIV
jgi:hypothetical protein